MDNSTIQANFNLIDKLLGRKTMHHAELKGWIAPEYCGSRKGKSVISQAVHKTLHTILFDNIGCHNDAIRYCILLLQSPIDAWVWHHHQWSVCWKVFRI